MLNGLLHTVEENIVRKCPAHKPQRYNDKVYLMQVMKGDHESLGATLIREVERNKLSSEERSWVAGTM